VLGRLLEKWSSLFEAEVLPRMDPTSRAVLAQVNRAGRTVGVPLKAGGFCRLRRAAGLGPVERVPVGRADVCPRCCGRGPIDASVGAGERLSVERRVTRCDREIDMGHRYGESMWEIGHQWDIDRDIDMVYGISIWAMEYRYGHPPYRHDHRGYRYGIWSNEMGDDRIDTVSSHIDMGYLVTLVATCWHAARGGHLEVVEWLIATGADVNYTRSELFE